MSDGISANYVAGSGAYQSYDEASQAAGRAVTSATVAGGDRSEYATVVYAGSDGYHFLPPVEGIGGHVQEAQVESLMAQANEVGDPEGLIHSHDNPDVQGKILSPDDYVEGDAWGVKVEVYSDNVNTGEYARSTWDPSTGEGSGSSEPIDAVSGADPAPVDDVDDGSTDPTASDPGYGLDDY